MSETAVGFAGIGRMGLPMAQNVLRAGFPLTVWNRTSARCAPLVEDGATLADTPADLAAANVVVTMVADADAARAVLVDSSLLARLAPGTVVQPEPHLTLRPRGGLPVIVRRAAAGAARVACAG